MLKCAENKLLITEIKQILHFLWKDNSRPTLLPWMGREEAEAGVFLLNWRLANETKHGIAV